MQTQHGSAWETQRMESLLALWAEQPLSSRQFSLPRCYGNRIQQASAHLSPVLGQTLMVSAFACHVGKEEAAAKRPCVASGNCRWQKRNESRCLWRTLCAWMRPQARGCSLLRPPQAGAVEQGRGSLCAPLLPPPTSLAPARKP